MKIRTRKRSRLFSIGLSSSAVLLAAATAPLILTGCGGGSSGSSGQSVPNNATAPASLPAGMVATTPYVQLTIIDGTHYSSVATANGVANGIVGISGSYTYSASGTTAVLTITPNGNAPEVDQLSNFVVTNGNYTSVFVTPPSSLSSPLNQPYTATLGGTAVTYTAPSGSPGNGGSGQTSSNTPVVGAVYRINSATGGDLQPATIGTTATVQAVTGASFTYVLSAGSATPTTAVFQSNGTYVEAGGDGTTTTFTFSGTNASSLTAVSVGPNGVNGAQTTETYLLTKQ